MVEIKFTPIGEIPEIRDTLKESFRKGLTRPLAWRRNQLHNLARMTQDNAEAFAQALATDLGRPKMEAYFAEVGAVIERCLLSAEKLEEWVKPETPNTPDWQKAWSAKIYKVSKGTILVIAPWNYPMILTLQPLLGAIASGCCAVIKPSEIAPNYAGMLANLLPKYLDSSAYRVVLGEVQETTKLLELQWDHIFYTGNGRVGRIIAAAAAKHLTPITLELGGKSPVIIDPAYDINIAAKRILWGKINNAGQICIAPDYVLIPRDKQDEFVTALTDHYHKFFPEGPLKSSSYSRIVSTVHHSRLTSLLARTKGTIALGGRVDDNKGFEPTVVRDVHDGDSLLEEELFGPILPVVPVASIAEAIDFVNARDRPLIIYAFTENSEVKQEILETTVSGNIVFNDTFQQLAVNELPFGGVGESGYGRQVMKYTFDIFTYLRSSIDMPKDAEKFLEARYPPYTEDKFKIMTASVHMKIPGDERDFVM